MNANRRCFSRKSIPTVKVFAVIFRCCAAIERMSCDLNNWSLRALKHTFQAVMGSMRGVWTMCGCFKCHCKIFWSQSNWKPNHTWHNRRHKGKMLTTTSVLRSVCRWTLRLTRLRLRSVTLQLNPPMFPQTLAILALTHLLQTVVVGGARSLRYTDPEF